jgi:hypothetical protein
MTVLQKNPVRTEAGIDAIRTVGRKSGLLEGFLELPPVVVLVTARLSGMAAIGLCTLSLYYMVWLLLGAFAGL